MEIVEVTEDKVGCILTIEEAALFRLRTGGFCSDLYEESINLLSKYFNSTNKYVYEECPFRVLSDMVPNLNTVSDHFVLRKDTTLFIEPL